MAKKTREFRCPPKDQVDGKFQNILYLICCVLDASSNEF